MDNFDDIKEERAYTGAKRQVVRFDEETHTYYDQFDKPFVSVTQLLELANITANYDNVDGATLKASAERGIGIHEEIENYVKNDEIGFTKELGQFIDYININSLVPVVSEEIVNNDLVAGTLDLVLMKPDGDYILADIKTTSTIHTDSVSWQCSIYKVLLELGVGYKISQLQVFHFDKNGNLEVRDLPIKDNSVIGELFNWYAYHKDEPFALSPIGQLTELCQVEKLIAYYKNLADEATKKETEMRDSLVAVMKDKGLTKFENDKISITYIPPTTAKTLDTALLKAEQPDLYTKYLKDTEKKEQVRIKLKGEK